MAGARSEILAGKAYVELYVRNTLFMRGLRQAKENLAQFGTDMQAFGRQIATLSAAAIIPLAFSAKKFAEFDDAMRSVKAVTQASQDEFIKLTNTAKELGRTTSYTAVEVANLMAELGRAGFKPDQVNAMTGAVLSLARATGTDATLASGIMAASIRQFGLAAGDAGRVSDGLTAAANKSFNTVEMLGEALSYAGPVARDFNMSFEDTLAVLGGLGNVGIQASNAGTAVRRLLTLNAAEANKIKGIFGVSFKDAAGNARPLIDTLGEVNEATKNLGTATRAEKFNEAFGLLGITGASALGRSAGDVKALAEEIKNAGGAAAKAAAEMDAGLGGSFRIFLSALEGVQIALGGALEGALKSIVDVGSELLGTVTALANANKPLIVSIAKWSLALGAAGAALMAIGLAASFASVVLGGLGAILTLAGSAIGVVVSAIALMFSPAALVVVLIAGIAGALLQATGSMDAFVAGGMGLFSSLGSLFSQLKTTAMDTFSGIRDAIGSGDMALAGKIAIAGLKLAFAQGLQAISDMIGGTIGGAFSKITAQILGGDFSGAWNTAVLGMSAIWESWSAGVVNTFIGVASKIINVWKTTVDMITNYLLQKAGEGGVFGSFLEQFSGVNVKEEMERKKRLDAEAARVGANSSDTGIFEDIAAGTYSDPATTALAAQLQEQLNTMRRVANEEAKATADALADGIAGGANEASDEVKRLEKELLELRAVAKFKREAANASGKGDNGAGGNQDGPNAVSGGSIGSGTPSTVTSSAAALIAMGRGFSESPTVKAVMQAKEAIVEQTKQQGIQAARQLDAIKNMGVEFIA